jgi:anti-sigma regulatory factor (Ser/Thr protein kinase)
MKLQVNAANTVRNFSSVMTDKTKFLSELIQNARRAGAGRVDIVVRENDGDVELVIEDNGHGISDFSKLFTLSESGWDAETVNNEFAFGMGFFSTLFVSKMIVLQSYGQAMSIDCELAKQMNDFGEPVVDLSSDNLTRITLKGVGLSADVIKHKLRQLAKTSRIEICIDGEPLSRENSFSALSAKAKHCVPSPFGDFLIFEDWGLEFNIIVQDLNVDSYGCGYIKNYLFSDTIKCRMPDRDTLVDSVQTKEEIVKWLSNYYAEKLEAIRASMSDDDAFLEQYFDAVVKYKSDVLLDIDYLPSCAFFPISYETKRDYYEGESYSHDSGIRKGDDYIGFASSPSVWDNPCAANFAFFGKARIPMHGLPDRHWFFDACLERDDHNFVVKCMDAKVFGFSLDYLGAGDMLVARSLIIEHKLSGKSVSVENSGFCASSDFFGHMKVGNATVMLDGQEIDVPTFVFSGDREHLFSDLLLQSADYQSDNEEYLDTELELDFASLSRQFVAAMEGDLSKVLEELLGELPPILAQKLNGKAMNVVFENGLAKFKLLAA